jgi:hypothetical protein
LAAIIRLRAAIAMLIVLNVIMLGQAGGLIPAG